MSDFELGRGVDPVPPEWRRADPARDRQARAIEDEVHVDIHAEHDDPLDPTERQWEQRVHYVFLPARP